jgi:hypothetical protein
MTAQEKAQELYFKYYQQVADGSFPEYNAKQCALVAVDEIIEQWELIHAYIANGMGELNPNLKYWYEVKDELTKQPEQLNSYEIHSNSSCVKTKSNFKLK